MNGVDASCGERTTRAKPRRAFSKSDLVNSQEREASPQSGGRALARCDIPAVAQPSCGTEELDAPLGLCIGVKAAA